MSFLKEIPDQTMSLAFVTLDEEDPCMWRSYQCPCHLFMDAPLSLYTSGSIVSSPLGSRMHQWKKISLKTTTTIWTSSKTNNRPSKGSNGNWTRWLVEQFLTCKRPQCLKMEWRSHQEVMHDPATQTPGLQRGPFLAVSWEILNTWCHQWIVPFMRNRNI